MTGIRRFGVIAGGLSGLAFGLVVALFVWWLTDPGRSATAGLAVLAGLVAMLGGVLGLVRADLLIRSLRSLSADQSTSQSTPLWPVELGSVAQQLKSIQRERDAAISAQQFVQLRLEAIVAGLRDGVIVVDPDLSIVSINGAASTMFRTTVQAAINRPLVEIARDSDLVRVTREGIEQGSAQTTPIDYRRAGRQFNVRVQPIGQGGRRLAILVVQDITELRQLENVRRDFVSNVSHELRTPLAAIRALVETLVDGAINDETVAYDFLNRVVGEVDRLNELIEDLLDLGRLESGRLPLRRSDISIQQLAKRAIERISPQAISAGIPISAEEQSSDTMLRVDVSRMEQVLIILLDNAIKFSPRGQVVTLRWRMAEAGIEIMVIDHGAGILPEDLPRVFERFYKSDRARRSEGTGLGLAIAKHIVAAHGGDLSAESVYEQGSTFTVRLPLAEISAGSSEDPMRPESRPPEY